MRKRAYLQSRVTLQDTNKLCAGGDNNYLSTRGGMRFWLRRSYLVDAEGEGVIPVPMAMSEWGTVWYQIINERRSRRLNYEKIDMATLTKTSITKEMSEFIKKNMVGNLMVGEILEYWLQDDN